MTNRRFIILAVLLAQTLGKASVAAEELLDITGARIVLPDGSTGPEKKAVGMLVDEVARRAQVRWQAASDWPTGDVPVIAIGRDSTLRAHAAKLGEKLFDDGAAKPAEGYRLRVERSGVTPIVIVMGNDARGVLFGVGRLLRELRMRRGSVAVPAGLDVRTAPRYRLRGHQLGYRPKTNSYDGWSLPLWEQYIRDLVVFGTNAVELIPPRSDDDADSPHFPLPPIEMMKGMSRLLDEYGLDVWIWYPAMDPDYTDPKTISAALAEWGDVFRELPRVDAVFVPGGDPGHTRPRTLMALLEKETEVLHRFHPRAEMWVSPQSFSQEWLDEFLSILKNEQPAWLSGIVFGPQVRGSLARLRSAVPAKYPIRHYPDITHSRQCQYPVPDWDVAYAVTESRECINPRPVGHARIFRLLQEATVGFITYSEGCNDDVNKIVWSALGWNPDASVRDILREYSRYFIGDAYVESFADGLLHLEQNWVGPLLTNAGVDDTLARFQALERGAAPAELLNWRFQQALYRAYYDAYVRSRLIQETALEDQAMALLRDAGHLGSLDAMAKAEGILARAPATWAAPSLRARIFELAEALFQSIRMQLSVERYKAIEVDRGATLDTVDVQLIAASWLRGRFADIRKLADESERLRAIDVIVRRTDPGPGGFYDDLGDASRQPHLVRGAGFENDPAFLESAHTGFADDPDGPRAWWHHAQSLQDAPLTMRYDGLDSAAQYKIRVVYGGETPSVMIRLDAGDGIEVHPLIKKPSPIQPIEFDIPLKATAGGSLTLRWSRPPGVGRNGRGCQVSEVWLMRK